MFAVITFAFSGGTYKRQKYLFTTDIPTLQHGDFVIVEGPDNEEKIAMFHRYADEDWFPEMPKKKVLKRAHWGTVKSFVSKKQAIFADYELSQQAAADLRKIMPDYKGCTLEEIRTLLIHRLAVAPKLPRKGKVIVHVYDKIYIVTLGKKITEVRVNPNPSMWKSPAKMEKYLV